MARYETTSALLGNGGIATLTLQAGREDSIVGMVFADQVGTLHIEQSMNGTNWDIDTTYAVTASDGKGFSEAIYAPFVRVRYVNGATPQGAFRLSARLSSAGVK